MTENDKVTAVDLITQPDLEGKVYAVASGVQIQIPVNPKTFVIDGDMSTMTEIVDPKPVTPGENIRCEIPPHLRERALRPYTTVTFYADTVPTRSEPASRDSPVGMFVTPLFPLGADFPPQVFRPQHRVPIAATIERDRIPSTTTILRQSTLIVQCGQLHGVVVGFEFDAKFLCGTCQATGEVGHEDFMVRCPSCDGTKIAKVQRDSDRAAVDYLRCNDVRVGVASQFITAESIPVAALGRGSMQTDTIIPGLLLSLSLSNTGRLPIRFGAKVLLAPPPPVPEQPAPFVRRNGSGPLAREVPATEPTEPEADCG